MILDFFSHMTRLAPPSLRFQVVSILSFFVSIVLVASFPSFGLSETTSAQSADMLLSGQPIDINDTKYQDLFRELQEKYKFTGRQLTTLFADLYIDNKVLQLMDRQGEAKPYYQYRSLFISPMAIAIGKQNLITHRQLFDNIEATFRVDREFIVAIWAIESRFGSNQGGFNLFQTLNTLFAAYPRRSLLYRDELINYLSLCRDNGLDPRSIKGSYAGAFGQAQFMPSSFNKYAVDFDGDRRPDLINSLPDIFASIANYLHKFGWMPHAPIYAELGRELLSKTLVEVYNSGRTGRIDWRQLSSLQNISLIRPQKDESLSIIGLERSPQDGGGMRFIAGYPNLQAITEYNHSSKYAMAVAEMAEAFKN
jgi:membrane-bound lytic murein transglycosylase B